MVLIQERLIQPTFTPIEDQVEINKKKKPVPNPRISRLKALLSYDNPDLEKIIDAFTYWSNLVVYLVLRRENIHTNEKTYKMAKAAKRGNDVYCAKLRRRLNHLYKLPKIEFFNYKDRNKIQKTRAIFVTLTYRRDLRLDEAWEQVGSDFNRWKSAMTKAFGKFDIVRCWESQQDGFPHIHCILLFRETEFETFFYNGKWRISRKRELEKYWAWGFSDMFAMYSLGAGVGYVMKYVTKVNNALLAEKRNRNDVLSLALMWIFRKRAFSVSKDFGMFLVEVKDDRPYGQVDLEGKTIYRWYLVGFWTDRKGEYDSWSVKLSYLEFWKIQSSKEFTFNKALFSD